jgi:hypothetical protein
MLNTELKMFSFALYTSPGFAKQIMLILGECSKYCKYEDFVEKYRLRP